MKINTINNVRAAIRARLTKGVLSDDGNIELLNVSFVADEDTIFGEVDHDYVRREIAWYESQQLNVNYLEDPIPFIWHLTADDNGFVNSNYGWAIYSQENGNQYANVVDELRKNPASRRGTMIYTRPSMWTDYNLNGKNDFMCTNTVQYKIDNNKLIAMVNMRSNDAVYGFKNDKAWQDYVHEKLSDELKIPCGTMYWNTNSLHVYPRHFDLVRDYE